MIRRANGREVEFLYQLALRSKGHWGYSSSFIDACRDELTVKVRDIEAGNVFVFDRAGKPAGFYSLERLSNERVELDFLFIEPKLIGTGLGGALFQHACGEATRRGYAVLEIQGDPNAEPFYIAMGARHSGSKASASIPGRTLPTFEVELESLQPA